MAEMKSDESDLGDPIMLRARARIVLLSERREVVEEAKVAWMSWKPTVRMGGRMDGATREPSRRFHL